MKEIINDFGIVVLERQGTSALDVIFGNDTLYKFRKNIKIVHNHIPNDISSTALRRNLSRSLSIKYLTEDAVIEYIERHKLFQPKE